MNLQLDAMSVAMPHVVGHPNRLPFRGVLTLVGTASQRSPSGARGHRVMLTRAATEAALPSLLGMALDYAPALDAHDARRKIGIITQADIVPMPQSKTSRLTAAPPLSPGAPPLSPSFGDRVGSQNPIGQIAISGYLFAHDFPDVVDEIRAQAGSTLGMSYEIADATVPNQEAAIWTVTAFTFTGAAVLHRDKAAYQTLSPMITALLAKQGVEGDALIETPIVEKALAGLSIEQRIAVKAELARAGILA